jgi:hypothetical protein
MQIGLTGMEMSFVILVNLPTTEVTGPLIVHLLPQQSQFIQPRWRKRLKHHNDKSRVLGSNPYRCLCFSDRKADELS